MSARKPVTGARQHTLATHQLAKVAAMVVVVMLVVMAATVVARVAAATLAEAGNKAQY